MRPALLALLSCQQAAAIRGVGALSFTTCAQALTRPRVGVVRCAARVRVVSVGKNKEKWLQQAIEIYVTRLRPVLSLEFQLVKDDDALEAAWLKAQESEPCIVLDENGQQYSSREFSHMLFDKIEEGGSRVTFVIGGAEGLPPALKASLKKQQLFSLGCLTFTHQMARLLLAEQVYRASEIRRGSGYHKD